MSAGAFSKNLWPVILVSAALLLTASGCWSRVELNELALVTAAGIDKAADGKIKLTIQVPRPAEIPPTAGDGGGTMGSRPTEVLSAEGRSLWEASQTLITGIHRRLFWGHCQAIVIGEDLAREGIKPVLDFFDRQVKARRRMWLLIAKGSPAEEILASRHPLETFNAPAIMAAMRQAPQLSTMIPVDLNNFLVTLSDETTEPLAGRIEVVEKAPGAGEQNGRGTEAQGLGQPRGSQGTAQKGRFVLAGGAAFQGDRLVGWLDSRDARGILWIQGRSQKNYVLVPAGQGEKQTISVQVTSSKTELIPTIAGNSVHMEIKLILDCAVQEAMAYVDLSRPESLPPLEEAVARQVKQDVENALNKAQRELRLDIVGFGEVVRREFPHQWKYLKSSWPEIFPHVKTTITVKAKICRVGPINKPARG